MFRPASAGDRYLSGLRAGDCGLPLRRLVHARVWMVACPPLLWGWRTAPSRVPLMPCASTKIYFRSILASCRLSFEWWFRRAWQVFSCLALSVPVAVLPDFSPADFSSVVMTRRGFLSVPGHSYCHPCRASPPFLGHSPFHW